MSKYRLLLKETLLYLFWAFLPFIILAIVLETIEMKLSIQLLLVFIAVAIEIWILQKFILPNFSDAVSEIIYSSSDYIDEESIQTKAGELLAKGRKDDAIALMQQLTDKRGRESTSWILRADFLSQEINDYEACLNVLQQAINAKKWNKEDQAYFLYRIGKVYSEHMKRQDKAVEYWEKASTKYSNTAYGRLAAQRLP